MVRSLAGCAMSVLMAASAGAVNIGEKPTLSVSTVDGGTIDLAKLRGKLVVVDFWTASDAAKHFQQRLGELNKEYSGSGVAFVSICCDLNAARGAQFAKDNAITWPMYYDGKFFTGPVSHAWNQTHVGDVLLGPDGSALWEGSALMVDRAIASALIEHPPTGCDPDVLKAANDSLASADGFLTKGDPVAALKAMAAVKPEAAQNQGFAKRQADELAKLDAATAQLLAPIDALIAQTQFGPAIDQLKLLETQLQGTAAEKEVHSRQTALTSNPAVKAVLNDQARRQSAETALAAARKLRDAGNDSAAYLAARAVCQDYAKTPAAAEAAGLVSAYEKDAALMKRVADEQADSQTRPILSMARSYAASGMAAAARERYQSVIDRYPGSHPAEIARQEMGALK